MYYKIFQEFSIRSQCPQQIGKCHEIIKNNLTMIIAMELLNNYQYINACYVYRTFIGNKQQEKIFRRKIKNKYMLKIE
jgi:hypothetical protein